MSFDYDKYLRPGKLPHIWCPGCGHGIVMKGLIRAIDTLGLEKNNTAIGGNHFIHACRRNIDMTYIIMNNNIYGMTGGQFSPCTPTGAKASTTVYGNPDPAFDIAKLAIGAGATFVARGTAYHATQIDKLIVEAVQHKGFSVVEILDDCPTTYGRRNKYKSVIEMMNRLKEVAVPVKAAEKMTAEQLQGKILTGVLYKEDRGTHYTAEYAKVIERASK